MPQDFVGTVSFLLSDAAEMVTGAVIDVGMLPGLFPDDAALF
jgi:hypothetical protein